MTNSWICRIPACDWRQCRIAPMYPRTRRGVCTPRSSAVDWDWMMPHNNNTGGGSLAHSTPHNNASCRASARPPLPLRLTSNAPAVRRVSALMRGAAQMRVRRSAWRGLRATRRARTWRTFKSSVVYSASQRSGRIFTKDAMVEDGEEEKSRQALPGERPVSWEAHILDTPRRWPKTGS